MELSTASRRAIEYRLFELRHKDLDNTRSMNPSEAHAAKIAEERAALEKDLVDSYSWSLSA